MGWVDESGAPTCSRGTLKHGSCVQLAPGNVVPIPGLEGLEHIVSGTATRGRVPFCMCTYGVATKMCIIMLYLLAGRQEASQPQERDS